MPVRDADDPELPSASGLQLGHPLEQLLRLLRTPRFQVGDFGGDHLMVLLVEPGSVQVDAGRGEMAADLLE